MSNRWQEMEPQKEVPKVDPWMSFGFALIIAVVAILFAAGTWIVRSGQATRAIERSAKASNDLASTKEKLASTEQERVQSQELAASRQQTIGELEAAAATLANEKLKVEAELAAAKRELEGSNAALTETRQRDRDPSILPAASLSEVVGRDPVQLLVFVTNDDRSVDLRDGPIMEHVKQESKIKCGMTFADTAKTYMVVSVIAVTSRLEDRTAISVSLELRKSFRAPGQAKSFLGTLWRQHAVGLSTMPSAASLADDLVDGMLDDLAKELKR